MKQITMLSFTILFHLSLTASTVFHLTIRVKVTMPFVTCTNEIKSSAEPRLSKIMMNFSPIQSTVKCVIVLTQHTNKAIFSSKIISVHKMQKKLASIKFVEIYSIQTLKYQ